MVTALGLYLTMATTHAQAGLLIVDVPLGGVWAVPYIPNGYRAGDHVPHMPGGGEPLIGREEIVGKGQLVDP